MGDSIGILPHSVMYGAVQMFVRYERFGKSCTKIAYLWTLFEDLMLQSAKGLPSSSGKIPENISPLIRSLNVSALTAYMEAVRTDTGLVSIIENNLDVASL